MSGPVSDAAPGAPTADAPNTVAPAVLEQHTPSIRYIDPSQSNVIMESGTKSANVSTTLFLAPYTQCRSNGCCHLGVMSNRMQDHYLMSSDAVPW